MLTLTPAEGWVYVITDAMLSELDTLSYEDLLEDLIE